jgi:hypothetical protein
MDRNEAFRQELYCFVNSPNLEAEGADTFSDPESLPI